MCVIVSLYSAVGVFVSLVLFLPSDSGVDLMDQRDGEIQAVVREFVLGVGTINKEQ